MIDFNLDIYEDFILENYDYEKENNNIHNLITETKTLEDNLISKLFRLIKNIGSWILKQLNYLKQILQSFFNKNTQTVEGILQKLNIKPNMTNINESGLEIKPFFTILNNKNDSFRIKINMFENTNLFYILKSLKDQYFNKIFYAFNYYIQNNDKSLLLNEFKNININENPFIRLEKIYKGIEYFDISMGDIDNIRKSIDSTMLLLGKVDNNYFLIDNDMVMNIRYIYHIIIYFQQSINALMNMMKLSQTLDKSYYDTIDNIEKLSLFVEEMVNCYYPIKNIKDNIRNIFKYYYSHNTINEGLGRLVIVPNNNTKVVHKISFNRFGLKSNRNEVRIANINKSNDIKLPLAKISDFSNNRYIIEMERIVGEKCNEEDIIKIKNYLNDHSLIKRRPIGDIKKENVIKNKNGLFIIDYGTFDYI